MNSQKINSNSEILSLITSQSEVFTVPLVFINLTGNHSIALVLSKFALLCSKSNDGWFYKKYEDWEKETTIKERTCEGFLIN